MNCPRCRALIAAEDVNLEHLLAKCRSCQEVFRFSANEIEAVTDKAREHDAVIELPRDTEPDLDIRVSAVKVPRPATIDVEDWGGERRLVKRWFNYSYIAMAFLCVFWSGILVLWYTIASEAFAATGPLVMAIYSVFHVAVGVIVTYRTLAGFCNRTVIALDGGVLEVWHGPIPWLGNTKLSVAAIEQLYCMEATHYWNSRNAYAQRIVTVNAVMANGATKTVVSSLPREEGLFIEQQLEEWLDIAPRQVPGQVD